MRLSRAPALVAAYAAWFAACEPRYTPEEQPAVDVRIPDREVEAGGALPVEVEVRNFDLVPIEDDAPLVVGQGHLHVYLTEGEDLRLATIGGQRVLVPLEEAAGPRKLVFALHHADHSPVDGAPDQAFDVVVTDPEVVFVVQRVNDAPFSPGEEASAELTVAGFALDAVDFEAALVPRHGHVHARFVQDDLDVDLGSFFDGKPRFTVPDDVVAGPATVSFALHDNLHGALDPPVAVDVDTTVAD